MSCLSADPSLVSIPTRLGEGLSTPLLTPFNSTFPTFVASERADASRSAARREQELDERDLLAAARLDADRKKLALEGEESRRTALAELKHVKRLVLESRGELERLATEKADAADALSKAREEASAFKAGVKREVATLTKDTARAQAEFATARDQLHEIKLERDQVAAAIENEIAEMREIRESEQVARLNERNQAAQEHAAAVADVEEKIEALKTM